jgi:hypothetical protein
LPGQVVGLLAEAPGVMTIAVKAPRPRRISIEAVAASLDKAAAFQLKSD